MKGSSANAAYNSRPVGEEAQLLRSRHSRVTPLLWQSRTLSLSQDFTVTTSFFHKLAFLGGKTWKIKRPVSMHRITGLCKSFSLFQSPAFSNLSCSLRVGGGTLHRVLNSLKGPPRFIVGLPRVPNTAAAFACPTLMTPFIGGTQPLKHTSQKSLGPTEKPWHCIVTNTNVLKMISLAGATSAALTANEMDQRCDSQNAAKVHEPDSREAKTQGVVSGV